MFMFVLIKKHAYSIGYSTGQDPVVVGFEINRLYNFLRLLAKTKNNFLFCLEIRNCVPPLIVYHCKMIHSYTNNIHGFLLTFY